MASLKQLLVSVTVIFLAWPGSAWSAGDRAAFEALIAEVAGRMPRPNAIAFFIGLGDVYCQMKRDRGGGSLDVQVAIGAYHRAHPESLRSADDTIMQDVAMNEAAKLLCPD